LLCFAFLLCIFALLLLLLQVAPVFTSMENELMVKMGRVLGGEYAAGAEGLFVPGGSLSNLYALTLARYR
jgi:glutamate/tyrosine decarboxylase-like PLP-dependent enzyme